jgi:hypothetical protein
MTVEFPTRFKGRLASALLILRLSLGLFLLLSASNYPANLVCFL